MQKKNLDDISNLNVNLSNQIEKSKLTNFKENFDNKSNIDFDNYNNYNNSNNERVVEFEEFYSNQKPKKNFTYDNSDNISGITEIKNNFKFNLENNNNDEILSTRNNRQLRNPYTNNTNSLSHKRKINDNVSNYNNDNFSVNRLYDNNINRLKNLEELENRGY